MNKRKLLTATAGVLMLAASSVFAHDGYWHRGYSHWHGYGGYYRPRVVVVPPAPVYYAPPRPVVVYPQPVYAPVAPVAVYPQPVYAPVAPVVVAPPRPTVVYRQPGFSIAVGF